MKKLLLLSTSLAIAADTCVIKTTSKFMVYDRPNMELQTTNQIVSNQKFPCDLTAPFTYNIEEKAEPNSTLEHTFILSEPRWYGMLSPQQYHITETIKLKGCDVESVDVSSDYLVETHDFHGDKIEITYRIEGQEPKKHLERLGDLIEKEAAKKNATKS